MKKLLLLTILFMSLLFSTSAFATVITFDDLIGTEDTDIGSEYLEQGYLFTADNGGNLYSWGSAVGEDGGYTGSAALFNESYTSTVLTSVDGSLFSLYSVDISELYMAWPYAAVLTITGIQQNGFMVTADITLDGTFGYETFVLEEGFTDLASVSFYSENLDDFQLDNLNVSASTVPVPGSFLILGSGLLAAAAIRRRM